MVRNFWLYELTRVCGYGIVAYAAGLLVQICHAKVNYTRKINFFNFFLLPFLLKRWFPFEHTPTRILLGGVLTGIFFLVLTEPIRKRASVFATMFASFDRPEDRPNTLYWFVTQILGGYAVLLPMGAVFAHRGISELMFLPILIHGIGDGLAEPVGIRWGRHKYSVRAFLDRSRLYTRSWEGSACVWISGIVSVSAFHASFSSVEFPVVLIVVPTLMTIAEAWSPHTWDTPYMFLAGTLSILAITAWR
jgi:dolichol kinase